MNDVLYKKLYIAWENEEKEEIQPLPENFSSDLKTYLEKLRNEFEVLDRKSLKSKLKFQEMENVKYLAKDLILKRFHKLIMIFYNTKIDRTLLTNDEKIIYDNLQQITKQIEKIIQNLNEATTENTKLQEKIIRFIQATPAIIGSDMKIYGPFKLEDIASIPVKNAENLIKREVAKQVDLQ